MFQVVTRFRLSSLLVAAAALLTVATSSPVWGNPRQITFSNGDGTPAWSPSGTTIVFSSERPGSVGLDLWSIPAQGGDATHLTSLTSNEFSPSWSPDSQQIAFYWAWEGDTYVLPAAGGPATRLTTESAEDPAWSPDGSTLAFAAAGGSQNLDIWIRPVAGGQSQRLTSDPGDDEDPCWSPDASTIAFISARGGLNRLWSMPAGGGIPTLLTEIDAIQPAWSPTGHWIAFASDLKIWVVSASGGTPIQITSGDALDFAPAWSPDGNEIVFMRRTGDDRNLFVVEVSAIAVEQRSWGSMKRGFGLQDPE